MDFLDVLIHLVLVGVPLSYFAIRYRYNYWIKRGFPQIDATFPYGSFKDLSLLWGTNSKYYEVYSLVTRGAVSGIYIFLNPVAVVTEAKLVETILKDNANHFEVEDLNLIESNESPSGNAFLFEGNKWRHLKDELVPKFIPHIAPMVPEMAVIGKRVAKSLRADFKRLLVSKVGDFASRYAIGATGYTLFGIRSIDVENPESLLYVSEKPGVPKDSKIAMFVFGEKFFKFCTRLGSRRDNFRVPHDAEVFYKAIKETVERRIKLNENKNDIVDLLLKAKSHSAKLTEEEIVNQAFLLFVAFHETTSAVMTLALYELAINQDVQDKLREEMRATLEKYNGQITYESIMEMRYLEQVVNETLRKYPPVPNLFRKTNRDFSVAPNRVIEKNVSILIPICGIQNDKSVFEEPEVFDPERFSPQNVKKIHPFSFLPFGERNDDNIGLNVVKTQVLIGLVQLLVNFKFLFYQRTRFPLEIVEKPLVATVKDEIYLRVKEICTE